MQKGALSLYLGGVIIERQTPRDNVMKKTIAIIGAAGNMGSGIARNLAKAGHRILLAGRNQSSLNDLLATIKAATPKADVEVLDCSKEASWEADIIVPAVPYLEQAAVAIRIKDVVTGKIVISIANPLNETYDGLVTEATTSAAEELAKLLPHSKIVKAFNTVFAADFTTPMVGGKTVDNFVAGDDEQAVTTVAELVKDAGFNPLVAGKLAVSRTLENMMVLLIGLTMKNNYNWHAGWKVLHQAA
jgi:8-hydroxy-5-deazaflavin:NADPH oxidoreductase